MDGITETDYMVSADNRTPWHNKGFVSNKKALSSEEALELSHLNWEVECESIHDADMVEIPTNRAIRRMDTREILGVMPATWTPIQNRKLLEIAEAIAQNNDDCDFIPKIETAGSLKGGRIVWALVQTGERHFADSLHKQYLLLSNGHGINRSIRGTATDTRVVCWNTLGWAEAGAAQLLLRHTPTVEQRLHEEIKLLGWANDQTDSLFGMYEALAATKLTEKKVQKVFNSTLDVIYRKSDTKARDESFDWLMDLYRIGEGNEGKTAFDAVNAVTDYVDHEKTFKGKENTENDMLFASFGLGDKMKKVALKKAFALTA